MCGGRLISFEERIAELVSAEVVSMQSLSGGDFATAYRIELDDGRAVFVKTHRNPPDGFFSTEAAGLSWLSEANVCNVASVLGVADDAPACLVLEWVDVGGRSTHQGEAEFGRDLARLHQSGSPCYGREDRRTTGSQALPNAPCDTWAEFYSECRLQPLARIASNRGALTQTTIKKLLDIAGRLDEFGAADEPAARLHGDLWAGNRVIDTQGQNWLIDPAAHGGHREFDLAMMQLFGGFAEACFTAYDETYPLADGWQDRVPLHQLAPLVVHAIKFGGGYARGVEAALDASSRAARRSASVTKRNLH